MPPVQCTRWFASWAFDVAAGRHGAFASYTTCTGFTDALARGRYDFLVAARPVFAISQDAEHARAWVWSSRIARTVPGAPDVVRLVGRPTPANCA